MNPHIWTVMAKHRTRHTGTKRDYQSLSEKGQNDTSISELDDEGIGDPLDKQEKKILKIFKNNKNNNLYKTISYTAARIAKTITTWIIRNGEYKKVNKNLMESVSNKKSKAEKEFHRWKKFHLKIFNQKYEIQSA